MDGSGPQYSFAPIRPPPLGGMRDGHIGEKKKKKKKRKMKICKREWHLISNRGRKMGRERGARHRLINLTAHFAAYAFCKGFLSGMATVSL